MKLIYSKHLKNRLKLRDIELKLPEKIFKQSKERFIDNETGHFIATMSIELYGKTRNVMLA
jgi:hypothetical protein